MKRAFGTVLGASLLLIGSVTTAFAANTVNFDPAENIILPHGTLTLDLYMDFTAEPTIGGTLDVDYDTSMLMYDSFVFNEGWGDDVAFRNNPTDLGGELDGLTIGQFSGMTGPAKIGTFTFTSTGMLGDTMVTPRNYDGTDWYPFFVADVTFADQIVDYSGAMVHVVPEMEVWAMMLAGMGLLGWKARRSQQRKEDDEALPA